jgi:hypothetical protein
MHKFGALQPLNLPFRELDKFPLLVKFFNHLRVTKSASAVIGLARSVTSSCGSISKLNDIFDPQADLPSVVTELIRPLALSIQLFHLLRVLLTMPLHSECQHTIKPRRNRGDVAIPELPRRPPGVEYRANPQTLQKGSHGLQTRMRRCAVQRVDRILQQLSCRDTER